MKFHCVVVFLSFLFAGDCKLRTDRDYWQSMAVDDLRSALNIKLNTGVAKNVILFIGDGMDPNTVTGARISQGGETSYLAWEKFPHVGILKTYSSNKQVPDSASTATALLCGVKVNQETLGVDARVPLGDWARAADARTHLTSILKLAQRQGKATGVVTTMRVTHATPAAAYARSADRRWECDARLPPGASPCKDIARQLVEDEPGKSFNVIMGGGRQVLVSNVTDSNEDPIDFGSCYSTDGRDLINAWANDKKARGLSHAIVTNNSDLLNLDVDNIEYVLGVFAKSHLKFEHERERGPSGMPSITEMTEAAIKILQKNKNGFLLVVEGGNIDMAHHRGRARAALGETAELAAAVAAAQRLAGPADTLTLVTSDHGHTLSISGYPDRGSDIFSIASVSKIDGKNYTTLSYATGGPKAFKYAISMNEPYTVVRKDPSLENIESFEYESLASVVTEEGVHGGGDVIVYANGPYAHLLHNVHEQHYIHHVIAYAAQLGPHTRRRPHPHTASPAHPLQLDYHLHLTLINAVIILIYLY